MFSVLHCQHGFKIFKSLRSVFILSYFPNFLRTAVAFPSPLSIFSTL